MRFTAIGPLALLFVSVTFTGVRAGDEDAVKGMIDGYTKAFNAQQIDQVMDYWSQGGVHIDHETGLRTEGHEAIRADISEVFQRRPNLKLIGRVERLRFIKEDVASVQGRVTVSAAGEEPTQTDFSAILVGQNGKWKIDTIEENPVPVPATSFDALSELSWLVGTWSDDSDQATIENVFRWSANSAFLIRSFSAESAEGQLRQGTQVIGWDPRSQEIRSWSFNSDGSFGDATWSKNGQDWLIKSSQTLADGQAASGTFVLSRIGDDRITLRLIGHEIEGEPQPSEGSVTVVRQRETSAEEPMDPIETASGKGGK